MEKYRPPDSDSDDSYDGFYFDDDPIERPPRPSLFQRVDSQQELYDAALSGDLETIKVHLSKAHIDINEPIRFGNTLLHHAAQGGQIELVSYLLENNADPNRHIDSFTPLMSACSCTKDGASALLVVQKLCEHNAVINISNRYGTTPLMFACIHGHLEVVQFLLPQAFIEASDNQDYTPLFHAIENNRPEIVRVLIEAGANVDVANRQGYTPYQVVQFCGFYDLLDILPAEEYRYIVPTSYLSYSSLSDRIPRLFLKTDMPEYFPDIDRALRKMDRHRFLDNFAMHDVNLAQFLTATDDDLKEIGIELPLHRKQILLGLLRYHLEHWSIDEIDRVKRKEHDNFYDILMIVSNQLKNVVIISSAIQFIQQNIEANRLGPIDEETIVKFRQTLNEYKKTIRKLRSESRYLASRSPKRPPMYIDDGETQEGPKKARIFTYIKSTVYLSVAIIIWLKWKKYF